MSKALDKSRVCPLLVGVKPSDIKDGPLLQFQAAVVSKDDMWKVVLSLNRQVEQAALEEPRLMKAFEKWWPDLEKRLTEELARPSASTVTAPPRLSSDELLEEILEVVRAQQKEVVGLREHMSQLGARLREVVRESRRRWVVRPRGGGAPTLLDISPQPLGGFALAVLDGDGNQQAKVSINFGSIGELVDCLKGLGLSPIAAQEAAEKLFATRVTQRLWLNRTPNTVAFALRLMIAAKQVRVIEEPRSLE